MAIKPVARATRIPTEDTVAPGAAAPALDAEKVPALLDGVEVVLVRIGVVFEEVVVLEVAEDEAVGVTVVAVVLGWTPAVVQYWVDSARYCFP